MRQEPKNTIYKVKVTVSGFAKEQIVEGLPALLDEFKNRPWLLEAEAYLDEANKLLIVIAGHEIDFRIEDRTFEEVFDCIFATMNFDKKINFDIERI